jgi:N-methylhydantoinase A/oxoprolinase/acetone carboxylase beta subunit
MLRAQTGSLATAEEFAAGILRVIDTEMEKAIRVISVERGHDPHEFPKTPLTITDPADHFRLDRHPSATREYGVLHETQ